MSEKRLLPPVVYSPWLYLWAAVLPVLALFVLNIRNYNIVEGDMSPDQKRNALLVGMAMVTLLVFYAIQAINGIMRRRSIGWGGSLLLIIPAVLYLTVFLMLGTDLIPRAATLWIVMPEEMIIHQFTCLMLPIVLGILQMAATPLNERMRLGLPKGVFSLLLVTGVGLGFVGLVYAAIHTRSSEWIVLALLPFVVFAFGYGFAQLGIALYRQACKAESASALAILAFFVGIVFPLIGLFVNKHIPFPNNFQSPIIYGLTIANGLLLMIPVSGPASFRRVLWLGQCLLLPFTLYFFVVFLPYLPASVPGLMVWGGGLLVLVPSMVLLLQGQRIYDGWRAETIRETRRILAVAGVVAVLVIPTALVVNAQNDRRILHEALDYAYAPDFETDQRFSGNRVALRRTLLQLKDFKEGHWVPYLSGFYNKMVFDGMVLPDKKINELQEMFFGESLPVRKHLSMPMGRGGMVTNSRRRRSGTAVPREVSLFPANVAFDKMDPEAESGRALVELDMENQSAEQSEFVTDLHVPDPLLISGFWLHVGDERVPGKLVEKKAAMFVYESIRDIERRDPGILRYTGHEKLELRVFPFAAREKRRVEIEFLYPPGYSGSITIGGQTVSIGDPRNDLRLGRHKVLVGRGKHGASAVFPAKALKSLSTVRRKPYLHFIVDRSRTANVANYAMALTVEEAFRKEPEADDAMVTIANYETVTLNADPVSQTDIAGLIQDGLQRTPPQGGFDSGRAIREALLAYEKRARTEEETWLLRYPVYVVLQSKEDPAVDVKGLRPFARLVPESRIHLCHMTDRPVWTSESLSDGFGGAEVCLFKSGGVLAALSGEVDPYVWPTVHFPMAKTDRLEMYESGAQSFRVVPTTRSEGRYAEGLMAWRACHRGARSPRFRNESLSEIVAASKSSGVLTPDVAYIVVESQSQWKMLEEAEKKKLKGHQGLEFTEKTTESVPEPGVPVLLALAVGCSLVRRKRK